MARELTQAARSLQPPTPRRRSPRSIGRHVLLMAGLLLFIFPFYWLVVSSLQSLADIYSTPIHLWPLRPTLQNYAEILGITPSETIAERGGVTMLRALRNSGLIGAIFTLGSVFLSSLAGYAFAKLRFRGSKFLFGVMLATMMIPGSVGLIPNYMIMAKLQWVNTWWPLIVPGLATAFGVFWMRQYISSVPDEMVEAAQMDGCGPFGIYWRIVLPVAMPGLAALTVFNFMGSWNSFLGPLIYLNDGRLYTAPLYLALLSNPANTGQPTPMHLVFTASLVSVLPILLLFLLAQRYFVAGLTAGSLK